MKIFYIVFLILYLSLISTKYSDENMKPLFECSADKTEPIPKLAKNISPLRNNNYKRSLDVDVDGFKDFNIYLDLFNFEYEVKLYNLTNQRQIFLSGMIKAINTTKALLKVKLTKNYRFYDNQILEENILKWDKTKIGSNISEGFQDLGIDLYIFVRFGNNYEMGQLSLASASARYLDPETGQPLIGIININKDVNYSKTNSFEFFEMIIMHEFTHVLGFSSHFFTTYFHNLLIKKDSYGIQRAFINSSRVVNTGKKYFNCETLEGVELEEFGGNETLRSHWEARILLGEYMNGVAYNEEVVISEFTLALLADSGYYKVNYYTGGLMQYGKNKGCDFLNKKCVNNGTVNPYFKNEFFDNIYYKSIDPSCSSGRQSRAYHGIYSFNSIPKEYQYYLDSSFGGRSSADYCPVSQEYYIEANNIYYVGHCSKKGSWEYGSKIPYRNMPGKINYYKSGEIRSITGERTSENSFCVLSSLISTKISNYSLYSNTIRAICYEMFCSEKSLTIRINNDYFICPRMGGKINGINFDGYLLCPDYYLICSGTVLCNDMFDCVEKKSLLKNITYDYKSKTSQDIKDAQNETFSTEAYELSDSGICPKFCSQCDIRSNCLKCSNFAGIYELVENGITKRKCKIISELTSYYMYEGVYYKCMDNCYTCYNGRECIACISDYININGWCSKKIQNCSSYDNNGRCTQCFKGFKVSNNGTICEIGIEKCKYFNKTNSICYSCEYNYVLYNNSCYKEIERCKIYDEEDQQKCKKCVEGYAFEGNNRTHCYNKSFFTEYYTKDNGISYYKCDVGIEKIENCSKCNYNNGLICKECRDNYLLKDDENKICYSKKLFNNSREYYYENYFHIKTCSKKIDNCEFCTKYSENVICDKCQNNYTLKNNTCFKIINNCEIYEGEYCKKCFNGYAFEGNDRKICRKNNTFEEYFTKDNGLSFYRCNDSSKGGINNCKKCKYNRNDTICYECKNNYVFKDHEKNMCYLRALYNNSKYYYEDNLNIRSCNKTLYACDECVKDYNNKVNCKKCLGGYYIVNNNNLRNCSKKIDINPVDEYYYDNFTKEYYSCSGKNHEIKYCQKCVNKSFCNLCQPSYTIIKNNSKLICKNIEDLGQKYIVDEFDNTTYIKCSNFMNNCDTCFSKNECLSCIEKYGLYKDKKTCINIKDQYHYKNINDNLYYLCNTTMKFCEKCISSFNCNKCINNFIKINNDRSICHPITKININEYYIDPNDDNMYLKCSSFVKNCISCNYTYGCSLCEKRYILLNDDTKNCQYKSNISLKSYFTFDNKTYFSCNDNRYKNNIECFSLIPQQSISLTFLQVQLINNKLICFMLTHSPLPKKFALKVLIIIFTSIRNLENSEEKEVILTNSDGINGINNTLVSFSSEEEYDSSISSIEIRDINFDNENNVTKIVIDNNKCFIKFKKSSELINTAKVKKLIGDNKIPDCSLIKPGDIINLDIDKIENCEINLKSNESVSFPDNQFNLELMEYGNNQNNINAECDTKKKDIAEINCKINDKVTKEYSLKEEIFPLSDKYIVIYTEKEKFNISCRDKIDFKKLLIIAILIFAVIILICIISCICACVCNKKEKDKPNINILPTNNSNHQQDFKNDIFMYNQKNNSKSFGSGFNSGLRLN